MLQKQAVNISLGQGVDTKSDPKQVVAGKLLVLENGIFTSKNRIKKRNGFKHLATTIDNSGTNITQGFGISTFKNELIEFTGTEIYSYADTIEKWYNKGQATALKLSQFPVIRNSNNQLVPDGTYHADSGLQVFTWEDLSGITGNGIKYNVIDSITGQVLVQNQSVAPTNYFKPKPIVVGQYVLIVYVDQVAHNLVYRAINTLDPTVLGPQTTIDALPASSSLKIYDAMAFNGSGFFAYKNSAGSISLCSIDSTLAISTPVVVAATIFNCIGIAGDPVLNQIWVGYHTGVAVNFFVRNISLGPVVGPVSVETISDIFSVTLSANNGFGKIFYTKRSSGNKYDDYVKKADINNAGGVTSVGFFLRSVSLWTKAFYYGSKIYVGISFDSDKFGSVNKNLQDTYFIANQDGKIVAKINQNNSGGRLTRSLLSEVTTIRDGAFLTACLEKDLFTTETGTASSPTAIYTQTGVTAIELDFLASDTFQTSELANNLHMTGGFLSMYDGVSVVEHGFHTYPLEPATALNAGVSTIQAGTYQYVVVYEWMDNQGQLHLSAPSIPVSVVIGTSDTTTVTLTIPTLRLTDKVAPRAPVVITVYRTQADLTTFYRLSSVSNPLFNDTTVDTVSYVDSVNDTFITGNPLLYTTGGILENIAPPATNLITNFHNRIVLVPSDDLLTFWYSKQITPGLPVEFSDFFVQSIDQRGGDITAVAAMDEKLILFKEKSIFFLVGNGPNNAGGQNDFSDLQLITTDGGCIDPKSVVLMPMGLMYKSQKGIYLLDRSLQVSYIGADVEGYNSINVTSAALVSKTNQVRFCLDNGTALVFDYYFNQWSVFTNVSSIDSCIFQSEFCFLKSNGTVAQETPGVYRDNTSFIKLKLVTSWLSFAGLQAFQRVYKLLILGEHITPHKLRVQIAYDFNPSALQEDYVDAGDLFPNLLYGDSSPYGADAVYGGEFPLYQFRIFTARQKCESIQFIIEDVQEPGFGESMSISNLAFEVGVKRGLNKLGANRSYG